jgi:hypothetical protein
MPKTLTREAEFTGQHPEVLRGFDELAGFAYHMTREDGPLVRSLRLGAPALGWEGDSRLQMYWDGSEARYVLMRLEHDGQYRAVTATKPHTILNEEKVNQVIRRLVETDVRRGFDVKSSVDTHNARLDTSNARTQGDKFESMADKLRWALKRDGVLNDC